MNSEVETRIDTLNHALDEIWEETRTDRLKTVVRLIAEKVDEHELSDMMSGGVG